MIFRTYVQHSLITATALFLTVVAALGQSGGPFTIQQSVIANGGGNAAAAPFTVEVTHAQPTAHAGMSNGSFAIMSGFWNPIFAPTAAPVSISGRVVDAEGRSIMSVSITCSDVYGNVRTTRTGAFGLYRFADLAAGETYIIRINSRRYFFAPRVVNANEDVVDVDFVAQQIL